MENDKLLDLVGIGFGPSNISVNICLREVLESTNEELKFAFFDKKPDFDWHSNLMIPGANLQVSFLKDLVTQRNPRSRYTFINFLFETNRLANFINFRRFEPFRIEFEEYLKWVVSQFKNDISFNTIITSIEPVMLETDCVEILKINSIDLVTQKKNTIYSKNILIATSGIPNLINSVDDDTRIIHSSRFLSKVEEFDEFLTKSKKIAVVGSGQSAIEMLIFLYERYPNLSIDCIFPEFAIKQSDSSLFVNEIFNTERVDEFYYGNEYVKEKLFVKDTNYNVVDEKEIVKLYEIVYLESFHEQKRLNFVNFSCVSKIKSNDDSVSLFIDNLKQENNYVSDVDFVFLGTGFKCNDFSFLDPIKHLIDYKDEEKKEFLVNRDYTVVTNEKLKAKLYVQGHSESQHGISNTLLSINSLRSQEITNTILKNKRANPISNVDFLNAIKLSQAE